MRHHHLRPAHSWCHAGRRRPCPPPSRNSRATCFSRIGILNKSADASTKAAEAANRSVAIDETAERAWIALSEIAFVNPADADNPLKVRLSYNNVGHQPAKSLKAWIDTGVIKEPPPNFEGRNAMTAWHKPALQPKSLCSQFADTQEVIVYPSSTIGFSIYTPKDPGILRYLEDIKSGHVIYIVIGCFSYETVGQPRLTSFCTFPHPLGAGKDLTQWKFSACPVGNDDFSP